MAFVFTVEDGTGLTNATSYVSVTEAEDYFAADPNFAETWDALGADSQEIYLAWATRILDQKTSWRGQKVATTQRLRWPRTGVTDADGETVDDAIVPQPVKDAVCELAKWLQENDPTTGPDRTDLKKLTVDVIEIEYQDGASQSAYPTIINDILTGLGTFRIGGRGYGRIIKA